MGQRREAAVAGEQRGTRREPAARAGTGDEDATRVDAELLGVLGRPDQPGIAVLNRGRVRVLRRQAVLHGDDDRADLEDVGQEHLDAGPHVADDHAAPVGVVDRRPRAGTGRRAQNEQGDLGVALRSRHRALLDDDRAAGGEVDRFDARYAVREGRAQGREAVGVERAHGGAEALHHCGQLRVERWSGGRGGGHRATPSSAVPNAVVGERDQCHWAAGPVGAADWLEPTAAPPPGGGGAGFARVRLSRRRSGGRRRRAPEPPWPRSGRRGRTRSSARSRCCRARRAGGWSGSRP